MASLVWEEPCICPPKKQHMRGGGSPDAILSVTAQHGVVAPEVEYASLALIQQMIGDERVAEPDTTTKETDQVTAEVSLPPLMASTTAHPTSVHSIVEDTAVSEIEVDSSVQQTVAEDGQAKQAPLASKVTKRVTWSIPDNPPERRSGPSRKLRSSTQEMASQSHVSNVCSSDQLTLLFDASPSPSSPSGPAGTKRMRASTSHKAVKKKKQVKKQVKQDLSCICSLCSNTIDDEDGLPVRPSIRCDNCSSW
eukprot:3913186-Prymnesium_polylepis.1